MEKVELELFETKALQEADELVLSQEKNELVEPQPLLSGPLEVAAEVPRPKLDHSESDAATVVTSNRSAKKMNANTTEEEQSDAFLTGENGSTDQSSVSSPPLLLHPSFAAPSSSLQSASNDLHISWQ